MYQKVLPSLLFTSVKKLPINGITRNSQNKVQFEQFTSIHTMPFTLLPKHVKIKFVLLTEDHVYNISVEIEKRGGLASQQTQMAPVTTILCRPTLNVRTLTDKECSSISAMSSMTNLKQIIIKINTNSLPV